MGELASHRRRIEVNGKTGVVVDMGNPLSDHCALIVASMLVRDKSYRPLLQALLRDGWRAVIVEMPGAGHASPLERPWTMSQYAQWIEDLLPALQLPIKPILIGHSNSGPPALLLCARRPDLFRGLVLADVTGADTRFAIWPLLIGRAIDSLIEWRLTLTALHHVLFNLLFHFRNAVNQIRLAAQTDIRQPAMLVTCPTLIAWGGRDHTCPLGCYELLKRLIPQASHHLSPHGSHDWLVTDSESFVEALDAATMGT